MCSGVTSDVVCSDVGSNVVGWVVDSDVGSDLGLGVGSNVVISDMGFGIGLNVGSDVASLNMGSLFDSLYQIWWPGISCRFVLVCEPWRYCKLG